MPLILYEYLDCAYTSEFYFNAKSHGELYNHEIETVIDRDEN